MNYWFVAPEESKFHVIMVNTTEVVDSSSRSMDTICIVIFVFVIVVHIVIIYYLLLLLSLFIQGNTVNV